MNPTIADDRHVRLKIVFDFKPPHECRVQPIFTRRVEPLVGKKIANRHRGIENQVIDIPKLHIQHSIRTPDDDRAGTQHVAQHDTRQEPTYNKVPLQVHPGSINVIYSIIDTDIAYRGHTVTTLGGNVNPRM